jgi:heme/copper-type cytochrome/quinol oxidase subunit 2
MESTPKTLWIGIALVTVSLLGTVTLGALVRRAHAGRPFGDRERAMRGRVEGSYDGYGPGQRYGYRMGRGFGGAIPPVEGARAVQITTTETGCAPGEISVKVEETVTVRFVNASNGERALIIPEQRILIQAGAGQTVLTGLRTDRAGEYRFGCRAPGTRPAAPAGRIVVTP